jgi:hypothetical protein
MKDFNKVSDLLKIANPETAHGGDELIVPFSTDHGHEKGQLCLGHISSATASLARSLFAFRLFTINYMH